MRRLRCTHVQPEVWDISVKAAKTCKNRKRLLPKVQSMWLRHSIPLIVSPLGRQVPIDMAPAVDPAASDNVGTPSGPIKKRNVHMNMYIRM